MCVQNVIKRVEYFIADFQRIKSMSFYLQGVLQQSLSFGLCTTVIICVRIE